MIGPAPLRFLAIVVGGWVGFRLVMLAPDWREDPRQPAASIEPSRAPPRARGPAPVLAQALPEDLPPPIEAFAAPRSVPQSWTAAAPNRLTTLPVPPTVALASVPFHVPLLTAPQLQPPRVAPQARAAPALVQPWQLSRAQLIRASRWSGSAWLFIRRGDGGADLAPGGTLGASQAGARLAYRINGDARRPLALSVRAYLPLDRMEGAEAAVGVDWKPVARWPIHLLAERRQRLGREGRSDFAVSLYAGAERRVLGGRVLLDAYGQAGAVGIEERDLFADGSARASLRAGRVDIGVGVWGGAQPGASRLDVGPQLSISPRLGRVGLRAAAEWRLRVAGDASPGSGPAVTISAGF